MHKHWDICFGAAGALSTWSLARVNLLLSLSVGILSLTVMLMRARREWRNRNQPPDKKDE